MPENDNLLIKTEKLTKTYSHAAVVSGLNLTIEKGCAVGFIGPNGAGKSTTIKMLMGLVRPNEGHARVIGFDPLLNRFDVQENVGYVPENHDMYPWMSVAQTLRFVRAFFPRWNDNLCAELVSKMGLDPRKKVKHLSKGMLAKLSLVLALSHEPSLLILDEPTTGLDPIVRDDFLSAMHEVVSRRELTILFSSHILSDVDSLANTVAILDQGDLKYYGAMTDLIKSTKRLDVKLSAEAPQPAFPAGTLRQQRENSTWQLTVHGFSSDTLDFLKAQPHVADVEVHDLSLETIFKDFIRGNEDVPC